MSGAAKQRRSAFSIYAEEKPEPEMATSSVNDQTRIIYKKKTNQNNNNKNKNKQNGHQNQNNNKSQFQNNMKKSYGGVTKPKNNQKKSKQVINKNICHSTPFQNALKSLAQVKKVKTLKPIVESNDSEDLEADELIQEQSEIFDSRQEAISLLKSIIYPVKVKEFFGNYWEQKPMLIKRENSEYNKAWFSCKEFDSILRNHTLEFTTNIDVTTYVDEVKQNHNTEGRAFAPLVWDFFQQGCSIRLLNPQTYSRNCWKFLSTLQELFGTCVGSNIYLTPAGTQGFAPHYDDIEAFVLQLEGKKRWRVYKPITKDQQLPKHSSRNFEQNEIGEPIIDCVLEPGDLLYFPRGFIHQAEACNDVHSLHITVSCYQKNCWGDFLTKLLPGAIEIAQQEDIEFRKGLPINYLLHNGVAFDKEEVTDDRKKFIDKTAKLIKKLINYIPIDAAVDQMAKQYLHDSMPPCLNESEKLRSIHGNGEKWNANKMRVEHIAEIEPDTAIKIIRRNSLRLVVEEESCLIYHNLENGKVYREKDPQYLEVESEAAPAIEFLINNYPEYCTVEDLPLKTMEEKIVVASCLYDKGLLVTGEPLESNGSSDSSETEEDYSEEDEVNSNNADLVESMSDDGDEDDTLNYAESFDSEEYDEDNGESENDEAEIDNESSSQEESEDDYQ